MAKQQLSEPPEDRRDRVRTWAAWSVIATVAIALLHVGRDILVPIVLAVLIWFLISGLARTMTRLPGIGPVIGLRVARIVAVIAFALLAISAGRVVAENLARIASGLDPTKSPLLADLMGLAARITGEEQISLQWVLQIYPYEQMVGSALAIVRDLVSNASLILLYVMFLMIDERYFSEKLGALLPDSGRRRRAMATLEAIGQEARIYLWLMFVISLGVGVMTFVICTLFSVKGAAFWGFLAFGLNFIPTIGSILAVIFPAIYALLTFDDPAALGGLIVSLSALQFVAGEVLLPRMMGRHLNLSAFVVLLSLVFWGTLWGPVGMFVGIPITVIAVFVCSHMPGGRPIAILLSRDGRIDTA